MISNFRCFFTICLLCVLGCGGTNGKTTKTTLPINGGTGNGSVTKHRTPNDIMKEMGNLTKLYKKAGSGEEISIRDSRGECFVDQASNSLCWRVWTCNEPDCAEKERVKFIKENPDVTIENGNPVWPKTKLKPTRPTCPVCGGTKLTQYYSPEDFKRKRELEQELKASRDWRKKNK